MATASLVLMTRNCRALDEHDDNLATIQRDESRLGIREMRVEGKATLATS